MMLLQPSKKPLQYWILVPLIVCSIVIFSTSFRNPNDTNLTNVPLKVVVDAGHGGMDFGATQGGIKEKDLTLALAMTLKQKAQGTNIKIILTRDGDELPLPGNIKESLKQRVLLTQEADVMVSIHVGINPPKSKPGFEGVLAFVSGKNDEYAKQSLPLANALLNGFMDGPLPIETNIQQKRQQSIYSLDSNPKPAVLLEVGFMDNSRDMKVLSTSDGVGQLATCILKGLQEYTRNIAPK